MFDALSSADLPGKVRHLIAPTPNTAQVKCISLTLLNSAENPPQPPPLSIHLNLKRNNETRSQNGRHYVGTLPLLTPPLPTILL